MKRNLQAWLPVAAICAAIFLLSGDGHSGQHSQTILAWLLGWVHADTPRNLALLHEPFRKLAHVVVYFTLGAFSYRAFARGSAPFVAGAARKALLFCLLYACSDEFHQRFVPTRGPSLRDVMLDTAAAALALAWIYLAKRETARLEAELSAT